MSQTKISTGCSLVGLLAVPLVLALAGIERPAPAPAATTIVEVDEAALLAEAAAVDPACDEAPASDPLVGVWHRFAAHSEGDLVRFYYFHGGGIGLYRYGKVGLTNTHAFDYRFVGGRVHLRFRKTGEEHTLAYRLEADPEIPGRTWLILEGDPREAGARYFRDGDARAVACDVDHEVDAAGGGIGNRLWSDERRFAAGGIGFGMYQLQPQTIDGRGVGWFHRGDYDEWTTEALTYRRAGDVLTLHFMLSGESISTPIAVVAGAREGERFLDVAEDPRDFWRGHRYRDAGPSFAAAGELGGALGIVGCGR
ncbi:MAG: hypothetical protein H6711_05840 [Myxococcales bacterium]|nr:hypothetical protein [Myxococcales bacterium]